MAEHDSKHTPEAEEEPVIYEEGPWSKYLWGANAAKLLAGHFYSINSTFGIYYITQFLLSLAAANFYSDSDRFISCGIANFDTPTTATKGLDMALYLLSIYHITEWLRTTLLLMISCVGANITILYYISMLNCIFGFVAYIFTYVTYFSEAGQACSKAQEYRGKFMLAEIILFWILFIPLIYPIGFLLCCKKQSHEQILNKVEDSEEED
jgi:hypothetical protein